MRCQEENIISMLQVISRARRAAAHHGFVRIKYEMTKRMRRKGDAAGRGSRKMGSHHRFTRLVSGQRIADERLRTYETVHSCSLLNCK